MRQSRVPRIFAARRRATDRNQPIPPGECATNGRAVSKSGLGFLAGEAQADVEGIVATSNEHTLADYNAARDRRDKYALAANIVYAAGGALLVGAAVVYLIRPKARVTASVSPGGVGVALRF
jgi:hypothetical protein